MQDDGRSPVSIFIGDQRFDFRDRQPSETATRGPRPSRHSLIDSSRTQSTATTEGERFLRVPEYSVGLVGPPQPNLLPQSTLDDTVVPPTVRLLRLDLFSFPARISLRSPKRFTTDKINIGLGRSYPSTPSFRRGFDGTSFER